MNKANIRRVATALITGELAKRARGHRIGYNQRPILDTEGEYPDRGGFNCKTTACIGGHAAIFAGQRIVRHKDGYTTIPNMWNAAKKYLGITEEVAQELFQGMPFCGGSFVTSQSPTARGAALVLFNLAETGKVNWNLAKGEA